MRKRIIALLLALVLALSLCACAGDGDGEKSEKKEKTADDYAEALYVAALTRMSNYYEFGIEIYRPDYNGDGTADWLIKFVGEYQPLWVLFEGGKLDENPKVFFNWGAAGELKMYTSKTNGGLYIENSYKVIAFGYESLFRFDGEAQDYDFYMTYESYDGTEETTVYDYTQSDGDGGMTEVSEEEYENALDKLRLEELQGGDTSFDKYLGAPEDKLLGISKRIRELPFTSNCALRDMDDDGEKELIFDTETGEDADGTVAPTGIAYVTYECGNEGRTEYGLSVFSEALSLAFDPGAAAQRLSLYERPETEHSTEQTNKTTSEESQELFNAMLGEWHNLETDATIYLQANGDVCSEFAPMGIWYLCSDGTVYSDGLSYEGNYTVSFSYDEVEGRECMTLENDQHIIKLYR